MPETPPTNPRWKRRQAWRKHRNAYKWPRMKKGTKAQRRELWHAEWKEHYRDAEMQP